MPIKKAKCQHCSKKIKGMEHSCECEKKKLCSKCRLPENHECSYNFQEEQKKKLQKTLIKVEHVKIAAI